ncbi:hypothetical protein ACTFIY_010201 [Dictyostelium cf. discoideum]
MIRFFTILFIFCLLLLNFTKGSTLEESEKICLDHLLSNLGLNTAIDCVNNTIVICSTNSQGTFVSGLVLKSNSDYQISSLDFQCFSKIIQVTISNSNISSSFFRGNTSIESVSFSNNTIAYDELFSSQINPKLKYLYITGIPSPNYQININFTIITSLSNFLAVDLKDIPPMDNVKCGSVTFRAFNSPSALGFSNIPTLRNINSIYLYITVGTLDFTQFGLIPKDNLINTIFFNGALISPTIVDLRNLTLLNYIDLRNVVLDFNYQGKIPLILPQSVTSLGISGSSFSGVNEFIGNYPRISTVALSFNQIPDSFTEWKNRGYTSFDLNDNKLQGTIDPSWCTTVLKIGNNQLSGNLPSCYTCHLLSSIVKLLVIGGGNSFTNINPIPECTTLIPNLRYNSSTKELTLYGDDLGFYAENVVVPGFDYSFSPKIQSKLFVASYVIQSNLPQILNFNFPGANKTFTLSTIQKPPIINTVITTAQSNSFILEGSFFNYNISSIEIFISGIQCSIMSATFYKVECLTFETYEKNTIGNVSIAIKDYYYTNLTILETSVIAYLNQTTQIKTCQSDCVSLGGFCNTFIGQCNIDCPNNCTDPLSGTCETSIGVCICNIGYQGIDCSEPNHSCPSNCNAQSNQGTCNSQNGICQCSSNFQGLDCSLPFKVCTSDCSLSLTQGSCNNQTGICQCVPNYQGSNCTIPSHYITSVIPCSIDGGEVLINGWFGNNNDGTHLLSSYNIVIGILDCIVTSINETEIKCNLGAGTGTKNIKIINSINPSVIFNGKGLFNYQNPIKTCPNSCTSLNNGKCNSNTGECECNDKFSGFDCSTPIKIIESAPPTNTSINKDTGGIELTNQDTIYEISIISLNEISIDGSIIKSHQLKGNWSNDNTTITPDSDYFKFSQKLINNTCKITFTIEEIKLKDKNFTFGTTRFKVEKDSIKLSVLIQDYQYQSSLNTLQLIFYSAVGDDSNSNSNSNDCNKQDTSIDTSNANNQQISNYIQISKNSKTLVGRFINQVIADSRSTFMSSTIIKDNDKSPSSSSSSVMLGLNLPHCKECLIDPDFSVLVSPDFKNSCNESNKNKWLIPVVVVISVVGCTFNGLVIKGSEDCLTTLNSQFQIKENCPNTYEHCISGDEENLSIILQIRNNLKYENSQCFKKVKEITIINSIIPKDLMVSFNGRSISLINCTIESLNLINPNENITDLSFKNISIQEKDFIHNTRTVYNFIKNFKSISYFSSTFNNITGSLSELEKLELKSFEINDNQLEGTFSSSWCKTLLKINNYTLNGNLPSCYTCHSNSDYVKNMILYGNNFLIADCKTLKQNLFYKSSSSELYLYGNDLGFISDDIKNDKYNSKLEKPTKFFIATNVNELDLPKYLNITFLGNKQKNFIIYNQNSTNCIFNNNFKKFRFLVRTNFNDPPLYSILVNDKNCTITNYTFYQVQCQIQGLIEYCSKVCQTLDDGICIRLKEYCSGRNIISNSCTSTAGSCNCLNDFQNSFCSYIPCNTDYSFDSNQGKCNNQTGLCECSSNSQGKNCELQFKNCSSDCSVPLSKGSCNNQTGICECFPNYQGSNCKIPSHYITSVIPCPIDGGEVLINGWFGNNNDGTHLLSSYNIAIGTLDCIISSINETEIKCNLGAGTGTKNIKIINSINPSVIFNGKGLFNYQNPIKSHQLKGNWSNDNTTITPDSDYFKFSQKLINNTCKITFTIEEIKLKDKNFTFGTTRFKVEKDSIKLSVLIQDYQYQSSLNTLQLIFYSAVGDDSNSNSNSNDCNKQDTSIDTSNANNQQISNYIQISKNSKTLVGRFINQVIADSRSTFMSSTIIKDKSSIKIGLNLPHCKECLIDPDFSVLVSPDFKESCNESTNKNKWFIPVIVVATVVGFAAILTLSIVLYRKNKYHIKIVSEKLKSLKRK